MESDRGHATIAATAKALATWRRRAGGRGRRIPNELWAEAAEVARARGVKETARALRLDARRLGQKVSGPAPSPTPTRAALGPAFVELGGIEVSAPRQVARVEFIGRGGEVVRVEAPVGAIDMVEIARAFWSRVT